MTTHDPVATTIWRLHLLPTRGENDQQKIAEIRKAAQTLCLDRSVLGMGWSVDADPGENISWTEYQARYEARYEEKVNNNVRRWKEKVKIGHLVWARTPNREYFLARVTGEWRYETAEEFKNADMVNIREVEFVSVGDISHMQDSDEANKVVQAFRRGWTLQKVNGVDNLSRDLWNQHCPPASPID